MAGYLFQPERALLHLAQAPRGATVGVETLDDVVTLLPNGRQIREQDKHSILARANLRETSFAFWNTLAIWVSAAESGEIVPQQTELQFVTNRSVPPGLIHDLKHLLKDATSVAAFVRRLRASAASVPATVKRVAEDVLRHSDDVLSAVVTCIRVFDSSDSVSGEDLKRRICELRGFPAEIETQVFRGLRGWVDDTILNLLRSGQPAWLTREAFDRQCLELLFAHGDVSFIRETAEALLPVSDRERSERRSSLFVKQLVWAGVPEGGDEILEAIDAHIRCTVEIRRLCREGYASQTDFSAFNERLLKRWTILARQRIPHPCPKAEPTCRKLGLALLRESLNHREVLKGHQTSEYYLTQGAYHQLADEPRVGWHPRYREKIQTETATARLRTRKK
jgi:hypothetical protein